MSRFLNTTFDDLRKFNITEPSIRSSLETTERPLFWLSLHKLMPVDHHGFLAQVNRHVINRLEFRQCGFQDILHPFVISGAESCMPVVQDRKFNGDDIANASLDPNPRLLDLSPKVK